MALFLRIVRSLGLLLARIAFGVVMILHGWARWTGEGGMAAQAAHLEQLGMPQPLLIAWGAMLLEVVGGVLMIFGAFTPVVAAFFVVEHVVVAVAIKWPHGVALESGGFEYSLILAALALVFVVYGAGRASVDSLFLRPAGEKGPRSGARVRDSDPA